MSKKYNVFIVRSVGYTVEVEANSSDEAGNIVSSMDYDELFEQGEFQHDDIEQLDVEEVSEDD